jgi:CheY-like chemotaxis protein
MTKVLVFESDASFATELESGLSQLGCETTLVDDANTGLQAAASTKPDLILLSIELPRMNGFSVCNKLKRDPSLKSVPLIIMSSDSTEETFEQHRRLRTRAEDYIHKPIAFGDLISRIRQFVPLPEGDGGAPVSEDAIMIEDDIVLDDAEPIESIDSDALSAAPLGGEPESVDQEVENFAESAFDALMDGGGNGAAAQAVPVAPAISSAPPPPPLRAASEPPPAPVPVRKSSTAPPPPPRARMGSIPPRPTPSVDTSRLQAEIDKQKSRVAELEGDLRAARSEVAELEDSARLAAAKDTEVQRLHREVDDLKSRLASSNKGAGSAREFLDLREQLNKKDKELLGLRDQLSAKDRDLLVLRDGQLVIEREKADLSDRILEQERLTLDAQRQLESLRADKEQATKRADDFRRKSDKLQGELEARMREISELKDAHTAEIGQRDLREASLRADHRDALERAEEQRQGEVLAAEQTGRDNLERALSEARSAAAQELAAALENAANAAAQAQAEAVAERETELKREHDSRLAALHRGNEDAMNKLRAEHAQAIGEATEIRENLESDLMATRAVLETKHNELEQLRADKESGDAARDARIAALGSDLQQRSEELSNARDTIESREGRIAAIERELAETSHELAEARDTSEQKGHRIATLEGALAERIQELTDARNTIEQRDNKIAQLEAELAAVHADLAESKGGLAAERERLAKARAKWSDDKSSLERAKDAMAAALAQIEEAEGRPFD